MKKTKILFFTVCLIVLVLFLGLKIHKEKTTVFGIYTISEQELHKLENERVKFEGYVDLYYKEIKIPYMNDSSNYIFPQEYNDEYNGIITCDNYSILYVDEGYSKSEYMEMNKPLKFVIYNDDVYKEVFLTLTNLPVITLDTIKGNKEINETRASFRIIEPSPNGREGIIVEKTCEANYHIRGGTSKLFPKKSYKLNLLDNKDNKISKELVGMREDDDWILNSMYIDDSRAREKLAYDLLNKFQNNNQSNMEYVELLIDQEYVGLYLLQVPYDYKYFGLNVKDDYLFKIKLYRENFDERSLYNDSVIVNKNEAIDEFKIKKYNSINYEKSIELLRAITYDAIKDKEYILNYSPNSEKISYDIKSYADYTLFSNIILANDNNYKNTLLICKKTKNGFIISKNLWDIDYSFMEDFYGLQTVDKICVDNFIPKEVLNSENYFKIQRIHYHEIRNQFYQADIITDLLNENLSKIVASGAVSREYQKWSVTGFEEDVNVIENFIKDRIQVLDKYYDYKEDLS